MNTLSLSHPVFVMLKPVGSACNMRCEYCYYLEKGKREDTDSGSGIMSEQLLEEFIRQYLDCQIQNDVLFIWHGGEPTLLPISYYRKALALQRKYARGKHIDNCIQTNGTLLTDEWCEFLAENNFLVGLSIDGPSIYHDEYRKMNGDDSSFIKVMRGIELLNKHHVEWNAMAVVNNINQHHPIEFYHFFKSIGCRFIQFTPIVERKRSGLLMSSDEGYFSESEMTPTSVNPEAYGKFLCALFDEWVKEDVGEYFIQFFESTLAGWGRRAGMNVTPSLCSMCYRCGNSAVMEKNGDVYSCDHYVFPQYKLGNIKKQTLTEMLYGQQQSEFGKKKSEGLSGKCQNCQWRFLCHGGCMKDRMPDGTNYLCPSYEMFFEHTAKWMSHFVKEC